MEGVEGHLGVGKIGAGGFAVAEAAVADVFVVFHFEIVGDALDGVAPLEGAEIVEGFGFGGFVFGFPGDGDGADGDGGVVGGEDVFIDAAVFDLIGEESVVALVEEGHVGVVFIIGEESRGGRWR